MDGGLLTSLFGFAVAALVIGLVGPRLTAVADELADRTGLGEALMGAVFLGASTSIPGIVTTVTAALAGEAQFAMSHALGGIAVQTAFLGLADFAHRKANLEHAAASVQNILQATLLIALLAILLLAFTSPAVTLWHVHPASLLLLVGYGFGLRLVATSRSHLMWAPRRTTETVEDVPNHHGGGGWKQLALLWGRLILLAALVGGAGYLVARSGMALVEQTGLSATIVGGLIATVITSLPELITTIAAVRQGALTLAVSGIIGGNMFDTLFAAIGDLAYFPGSIYHAVSMRELFLISLTMLMVTVLIMGMVRREKHGIANIGFESALVLVIYAAGFVILFLQG